MEEYCVKFSREMDFPHGLGAVNGKHVQITAPPGSGSYYFNFKKLKYCVNGNSEFSL